MEEILGRDTAVIHARPADPVHLEKDDRTLELDRPEGREVAAGPSPYDRDIFLDLHGTVLSL